MPWVWLPFKTTPLSEPLSIFLPHAPWFICLLTPCILLIRHNFHVTGHTCYFWMPSFLLSFSFVPWTATLHFLFSLLLCYLLSNLLAAYLMSLSCGWDVMPLDNVWYMKAVMQAALWCIACFLLEEGCHLELAIDFEQILIVDAVENKRSSRRVCVRGIGLHWMRHKISQLNFAGYGKTMIRNRICWSI